MEVIFLQKIMKQWSVKLKVEQNGGDVCCLKGIKPL